MSATALVLILIAAIAHATWNLFSKQASVSGPTSFVWLMALLGTVLYAPVVAVALLLSPPRLTAEAWVFLTGTGLLQVGYFLFLGAANLVALSYLDDAGWMNFKFYGTLGLSAIFIAAQAWWIASRMHGHDNPAG